MNEFIFMTTQGLLACFTGSTMGLNCIGQANGLLPLIGASIGIVFYIFTYKSMRRKYYAN